MKIRDGQHLPFPVLLGLLAVCAIAIAGLYLLRKFYRQYERHSREQHAAQVLQSQIYASNNNNVSRDYMMRRLDLGRIMKRRRVGKVNTL